MATGDRLQGFVGAALATGRGRGEIRAALQDAGWSAPEIDTALGAYAETPFPVPVPRPVPILSARDFLFQALLLVALSVVAYNLVLVLHALIDLILAAAPAAGPQVDWRGRRFDRALAGIIVFAPIYVGMAVADRRAMAGTDRSLVRRWVTAVILLATTLVLLGLLASVVYEFLRGEPRPAFLLKALAAGAVSGAILLAYRRV